MTDAKKEELQELQSLRLRLSEAEDALHAISSGEVDSLVITGPNGPRIFSLEDTNTPYRVLIEQMNEGALTLSPQGCVLYCNPRFAEMVQVPMDHVMGSSFHTYLAPSASAQGAALLQQVQVERCHAEVDALRSDQTLLPMRVSMNRLPSGSIGVVATDLSEARRKEATLRESEQRFRMMADSAPVLIWIAGVDALCFWFNKIWLEFTGRTMEQEMGNGWTDGVHPDDLQRCLEIYTDHFDQRRPFSIDYRLKRHDGEYRWLLDNGVPRFEADGQFAGFIGSCIDITERKLVQSKLELAANVFSHAREGIIITDASGTIVEVNETFCRISGYSRDEALGQNPRLVKSDRQSLAFYSAMWRSLLEKGHWYGELWNRRKNGAEYAVLITISAVRDATGATQNYVSLFSDITTIKDHAHQLEHIAHYDALTGLPNRVLLSDRLAQALLQCERSSQTLAVAYLDLDGFKLINDVYGHEMGDLLLVALAQRMKTVMREGDTLARMGGDEFAVVLVDLAPTMDCTPVLERLLQAASEPITIRNEILQVSVSIGVTHYPKDGGDTDLLLRHADQAMYAAKQAGRNRFLMFDLALDAAIQTQQQSLASIRRALAHNEFVLHYQPKVNMRTRKVIGVEALIRWQHPERGLLTPAAFLPIIEEDPLGVEVGEWVIATALAQMSEWHALGLDVAVSVNIGARQLQQVDFVPRLAMEMGNYPDISPHMLELEVLETSGLENLSTVASAMDACRAMGLSFALDDFGTGYSSLTYLKRLHAEVIKIDQSFIRDMLVDREDLSIVKGIIGLAAAFNRQVIAEGVETDAHGECLLALGCDLGQGYAIARPMSAAAFVLWNTSWGAAQRML
jgi:diguanylate cyclase (GGDEF)-like protein/PAS domain S-box-containing protein